MKNLTAILVLAMTMITGVQTAEARSAYQVYQVRSNGVQTGFGAVNLNQSSAVTGVLPNANTTAASANTASAIVARDGSGNFAAGAITASSFIGPITGNASTATALAANPVDCNPGDFAIAIAANGDLTCATPTGSQAGILFEDEGVALGAAGTVDNIDFVGAGVSAARVGNTVTVTVSSAGAGDFSSNTATSVDSEIVLFSGTGGKTGKRATGTGVAHVTSGVYSASNVVNADVDAAAAIARTKLASGSNNHVLINDGSGVMSSEASLAETRGGTHQTTYATGDTLYASASNTLSKLSAGVDGSIQTMVGGIPAWIIQGLPYGRYARLSDEKANTTAAGGMTAATDTQRTITTEYDPAQFVTLSSNQFTLQAGTYRILARVPGFRVDFHKAKLRNVTDSADTLIGTNANSNATDGDQSYSVIQGEFTISAAKTFEISHRCSTTKATNGLGVNTSLGTTEVYTVVDLIKVESASGFSASDWVAYTSTITGAGSETNKTAFWRRIGDSMEIRLNFTTATTSGVAATATLPSGISIDTTKMPSSGNAIIGVAEMGGTTSRELTVLFKPSDATKIYFGAHVDAGGSGLTDDVGSTVWNNTSAVSYVIKVPVVGWTQSPSGTYAKLSDVQSSGTNGGSFTSGSYQTRVLNTEYDPNNIVTLASNQFTLTAGTYRITASAPSYQVDYNKLRIRNITDSSDALIGSTVWPPSGTSSMMLSHVAGEITISGTKTFELQHRCSTTNGGTNGRGLSAGFGDSEIYGVVEITKIQ